MVKPLISICIPVFNEEENVAAVVSEIQKLATAEPNYEFEFIFTDNASTDGTHEKLNQFRQQDDRIRILKFSRNFGFQKSILTNFQAARGVAAVQIDADLQDPPSMVSEFLRHWERGYKVVYGIRRQRQEGVVITYLRKRYYKLVTYLSDVDVPVDVGDFRLIDRVIIEHLKSVKDQSPYLRGLIAGFGYAQVGVPYDRQERKAGKSKFGLVKLIELGLDGITAQSTRPLRYLTMFGIAVSTTAILLALYYLVQGIFFGLHREVAGFTTIVLMLLLIIGLLSFMLGMLGEYVGRIFNNTRGLPMTIVETATEVRNGVAEFDQQIANANERQP